MDILSFMGVMLLAGVVYVLPIVIVTYRHHPHRTAIIVLVLTFGWSGVGWLAALGWALLPVRREANGGG